MARIIVFQRIEIEVRESVRASNDANGLRDSAGEMNGAFNERLPGDFEESFVLAHAGTFAARKNERRYAVALRRRAGHFTGL